MSSGGVAKLVKAPRASDRMIAGSMRVLGITSFCPWKRHFNANFLTSSFCGMEDSTGDCFTTAFTGEKNLKNQIKNKWTLCCRYLRKWVWVTIALCLTSDVAQRVRKINRTKKQLKKLLFTLRCDLCLTITL